MNLTLNSSGEEVKSIQEILLLLGFKPGPADGLYGLKTERAVIHFQELNQLYSDGVVGPLTFEALRRAMLNHVDEQSPPEPQGDQLLSWVRVPADSYRQGYNRFFLRSDVAAAYLEVRQKVLKKGGLLTSSGARRSLNASVNPSRSATSFHYTGRALDLFVGSAMENTARDPYVVCADEDRFWRVFARAERGEQMTLQALTYGSRKRARQVQGRFIDLTALFEEAGFARIRARKSFFGGGSWLGAEWWHFQYERGLERGVATFGEELLKVYPQ
ncbi:MAG: peptidoglycan-binding domain-containing protein, partial [Pseudomonadales bacterium]